MGLVFIQKRCVGIGYNAEIMQSNNDYLDKKYNPCYTIIAKENFVIYIFKEETVMKRFTRFFSSVLAALLTLSALVTVTNAKQFTDVSSTAPLLDAINYAVDNNFIEGTSNTTFSPNSYMTRGNMVLMLYRHSGETVNSTNTGFTDVSSSSVYVRAVVWAVANEITNGTSSTTFEPNTNIKRQDAAVMMYRYAQYMGHRTDYTSTLDGFTDSGRVQSYALPAMKWAVGAGIIGGTSATTLEPRVALKRGAAAAMLQRYGFTAEGLNVDRDVYGFNNIIENFPLSGGSSLFNPNAPCYYIDEDDVNILIHYCYETEDVFFNDKWDTVVDYITSTPWEGSCNGMNITLLLDKAGQIDINSRVSNTLYPIDIGNNMSNGRLESLINYYHSLQHLLGYECESVYSYPENSRNLIADMEQIGLCIIGIFAQFDPNSIYHSGHSVIGYRSEILNNEGDCKIYVYDPNIDYDENSNGILFEPYIYVDWYGDSISSVKYYLPRLPFDNYGNGDYIEYRVSYIGHKNIYTLCDDYKSYDIDGPYNIGVPEATATSTNTFSNSQKLGNTDSTYIPPLIKELTDNSKTTLYVNYSSDFTITNNEGLHLKYDAKTDTFSGDMCIYRNTKSFLDGFTLVLTVPASYSYTITSNEGNIGFNVLSEDGFNGAKVLNTESITVSISGDITIKGENAIASSTYGANSVNFVRKEVK